jgi:uncharacterized damage-inducible protein DinB
MTNEQATFLAEYMTKLWEGEFPATCKVLAAVPDAQSSYKPDEKSRSAWELATHLASADIWFLQSIIDGAFAWDPDAAKKRESSVQSIDEVVESYKQTFPAKLAEVRSLPVDKLTRTVDFFGLFQWPAVAYLGFANNHSIHHRGQLAAYLRAMGSKVPAIYGGSADEPMVA